MSDPSIVIRTARLTLRNFDPADAADMFEMNSDPAVIKYTGDDPFDSVEAARKFINGYEAYKKYGCGRWTVLFGGTYAGWCGLNFNFDVQETDLGFRLKKNFWSKGIATEAAQACVDYGLRNLGLTRIIGRAMEENSASIRVLEKVGMRFEKEFEAHGGKCVQYAINFSERPHKTENINI
jgi:ribosomal-protein-alanine N-acetyltransferase